MLRVVQFPDAVHGYVEQGPYVDGERHGGELSAAEVAAGHPAAYEIGATRPARRKPLPRLWASPPRPSA